MSHLWINDTGGCQRTVFHNHWPSQCQRKPTSSVGGVPFCVQHAQIVAREEQARFDRELASQFKVENP